MRSSYKRLGPYIQPVNIRNTELEVELLLGVSIQKVLMPSIANTVGTNMKTYKILKKGQFAYGPVTSRNGDKISIALLEDHDEAIISQAYTVFDIIDKNELDPEYLMMWFRRPEFDRYARFKSHGSAREIFDWEEMCDVELPIPSIEKQRAIVKEYNTVVNRIKLNEQLNQKLEEMARNVFEEFFNWNNEENWKDTRLGDLIQINGGYSYNAAELGLGNSYLLGMGCISFIDRFVSQGIRLYSDDFPQKHEVNPGDIVIATRQQSENMPILGFPAMIPPELEGKKLIAASNLYKVKNNSSFNNFLLYQLLRSNSYLENIKLNTKGTTVGMITKDAIEDYYFKSPPISTVNKLNEIFKKIGSYIFLTRKENIDLEKFKNLILSKMTQVEEKELIQSQT